MCVQAVLAQEEGEKKMHVHLQCAAVFVFAPYEKLGTDLTALLRILCDFRVKTEYKWSLKAVVHPYASEEQIGLHKVNLPGLFGYCLKQRYTSSVFKCDPLLPSRCCMTHAVLCVAVCKLGLQLQIPCRTTDASCCTECMQMNIF